MLADDEIFCGIFVPGTPLVITGARDGQVAFWDTRTGLQARSPVFVGGHVKELRLLAGGRRLAVNRQQGPSGSGLCLLDVPALLAEPTLPIEDAVQLAELDDAATVRNANLEPLVAPDWIERWRAFRTRHPDWHTLGPPASLPAVSAPRSGG